MSEQRFSEHLQNFGDPAWDAKRREKLSGLEAIERMVDSAKAAKSPEQMKQAMKAFDEWRRRFTPWRPPENDGHGTPEDGQIDRKWRNVENKIDNVYNQPWMK